MIEPASAAILGFAVLMVKHTLADFFFQTPYQFLNKGIYGHPGGLLHAGIHAALTAPVFVVLPAGSILVAVLVLAAEFVAHYHVDWAKEQVVKRQSLKPDMAGFWRVFGLDQLAHLLTYVAIVAFLVR